VPKRGGGARRSALAAQWQPCYAEPGIKLVGDEIAKVTDVQESRHCCVACKNVPACTAWSYNTDSRKCKLFTPGTYSREECKIGVVGVLRWRLE
jgi:predicted nucleic-acid-binding Zn-ribbon protein